MKSFPLGTCPWGLVSVHMETNMQIKYWGFKPGGERIDLGCNRFAAPRLARAAGITEVFGFNPNNGATFMI